MGVGKTLFSNVPVLSIVLSIFRPSLSRRFVKYLYSAFSSFVDNDVLKLMSAAAPLKLGDETYCVFETA